MVRDEIPSFLEKKGVPAKFSLCSKEEYAPLLRAKLLEEVDEYLASESIEEIADILEVIEAICVQKGFSEMEIRRIKQEKRAERGGFQKGVILEETS